MTGGEDARLAKVNPSQTKPVEYFLFEVSQSGVAMGADGQVSVPGWWVQVAL